MFTKHAPSPSIYHEHRIIHIIVHDSRIGSELLYNMHTIDSYLFL